MDAPTKTNTGGINRDQARIPDDMRVYVFTDVHGCMDHFKRLIRKIEADQEQEQGLRIRLVGLGDYIDRGPDSNKVIATLLRFEQQSDKVILLRGNHEQQLLNFISDPLENGDVFLRYGGLDTLASYGYKTRLPIFNRGFERIRDRALEHIPQEHIDFIKRLKWTFDIGDYHFVHAGVDPSKPFNKQTIEDMLYMRDPFLSHQGLLEKVVVHGHTPLQRPDPQINRINIDTHCYHRGMLTSLVLQGNSQRFIWIRD